MPSLDQMEVIVDPVGIHFGGQFIEMEGEFGQMATIIGNGALTFSGDDNFLLKLGQ